MKLWLVGIIGIILIARAAPLNLALLEDDAVAPFGRSPTGELNIALSASICRYCLCDVHAASVTCNSERRMRLKVVSLPPWAETFRAHNLSMPDLPHFAYHTRLKTVRINFCTLERVHADALAPLPALETLDLADNALAALPVGLLERAARLRTLNLAHNRLADLAAFQMRLRENFLLDELTLSGNPLAGASTPPRWAWPAARRLRLDAANIHGLNATHITFGRSNITPAHWQNVLRIPPYVTQSLELLDLSENVGLILDVGALYTLSNLTALALRRVRALPLATLEWLRSPQTRLRRLDLSGARFTPDGVPLRAWRDFCGAQLAWLDVSAMGLEELELDAGCGIQWLYAGGNRLTRVKIARRAGETPPLRALHLEDNRLTRWPLAATDEDANFEPNGSNRGRTFYQVARPKRNVLPETPRHIRHRNTGAAVAIRSVGSCGFEALEMLSLANNLLEGDVSCETLAGLNALTHLNLANNRLTSICGDRTYRSDQIFDYHDDVHLDLSSLIAVEDEDDEALLPRLAVLNASGNALWDLNTLPRLDALAVLDASSNALDVADICALLKRAPSLQHLHLARNPHLGRPGRFRSANCTAHSAVGQRLVDLDLAGCALRDQPDLRGFAHLSALNLAMNLLRTIDANRLPSCVAALDANENRVDRVANFTDDQLFCLRHLRLARNSLRCGCSVQRYASILQQEDEFYDRTEYYCFTSDGWQHPLSAFLDANAERCVAEDDGADDDQRHRAYRNAAAAMLLSAAHTARFITIALLACAGALALAFVVVRVYRAVAATGRLSPITYKRISQADAPPVSL